MEINGDYRGVETIHFAKKIDGKRRISLGWPYYHSMTIKLEREHATVHVRVRRSYTLPLLSIPDPN